VEGVEQAPGRVPGILRGGRATPQLCAGFVLALGAALAGAQDWTPVRDSVYLQESARVLPTARAVRAVAVFGGRVLAGQDAGLFEWAGDGLVPVPGAPEEAVRRLRVVEGALYVLTDRALHRMVGSAWTRLAEGPHVDVCAWRGETVAATRGRLFRVRDAGLIPLGDGDSPGPIQALVPHAENLYCLGYDRLFLFADPGYVTEGMVEFGSPASKDLRAAVSLGNRMVVGMHQGVGVYRGSAVSHVLASDGLPYEECTSVARGFAGDYWVGTTRGLVRVLPDDFHAFAAPRWLAPGRVNDLAVAPSDTPGDAQPHRVVAGTDGGVAVLSYTPYTLEKKAAYYEAHLEAWAQKRGVFTHKLEWNAGAGQWRREVSDNDVGWSTHYWAAHAYRFAATGDAQSRAIATAGFEALKWSEEITTIDGFPARSIWAVGETSHRTEGGSGGYAAEWHPTPDGLWHWKGDTSSDELDAQFYYAALYHELVADGAGRARVAEHVGRIADHLIRNGYTLRDVDGEPTVWGRWDPEHFASLRGSYARGLNGLEMLAYVRTAAALTGEARFADAMRQLVEWGYPEPTIRQKHTWPAPLVNHSDDRLAFYVYYPLLRHERDPGLRAIYRRGLERSWAIERIEHNPWFNFLYGALTGNDCEVAESVEHLRAWPLDLVRHPWDVTNRAGMGPKPGYLPYAGVERPVSPRERGGYRWSEHPGEARGGSGHEVIDPAGWLEAYWMGRYFGMILPPETTDPALLTVPPLPPRADVVPYDGPEMPGMAAVTGLAGAGSTLP
jgi:hypothetical protein